MTSFFQSRSISDQSLSDVDFKNKNFGSGVNLISQFPGLDLDCITGILIQSSISEFLGMAQAVLLENHPKQSM